MLTKIFNTYKDGNHKVYIIFGIKFKVNLVKNIQNKISRCEIKHNKIVFVNFTHGSYGDSPKYIAEELLKRKGEYDLVWLVKNPVGERKNFPKGIRLVKHSSRRALKELASARVWVSNTRLNYYIRKGLFKKNGQIYIQTWHGGLGIKKIEKDIETSPGYETYMKLAKQDSAMEDYLLSTSGYETEIFKNCFWFNNKFLEIGYPRNDIFFLNKEDKANKIKEIKEYLGIPQDRKVILYAPTFRDNRKVNIYDIDLDRVQKEFENKYGEKYVTLVRLHPHLKSKFHQISKKYPHAVNATTYPDIQELLLCSDVLITDYSSSIFDFMLNSKPVFIFADDYQEYTKERGFYLDMNTLPFPIAFSNDDLASKIKNFDKDLYKTNLDVFMQNRKCFDRGFASKYIADLIDSAIQKRTITLSKEVTNLEYLKKYMYALYEPENFDFAPNPNVKINSAVWQMWWQGEEQAPEFVKKCLNSVKNFYPNRILITEKNYKDYVTLPKFIEEKVSKKIISLTHFSDIIRVLLLCKYGGTWVDSTCFLTDKIPDSILKQDVFYFKSPAWYQSASVLSTELLCKTINSPKCTGSIYSGSSWFISGKQNNILLTSIKKILVEFWKNEDIITDYYLFHLLLSLIIIDNEECRRSYENMPGLSSQNPHLLQFSLADNYSESLLEEIKKLSFIHKLTYKNLDKAKRNKNSFYNYLINKY